MSDDVTRQDEFDFDGNQLQIPVKYGGKTYLLLEAGSDAVVAYRDQIAAGVTLGLQGKPHKMSNIAGAEPALLAKCLYTTRVEDPNFPDVVVPDKLVGSTVLKSWPNRVAKPLIKKLKEISEIDELEGLEALLEQRRELDKRIAELQEEKAKNEQFEMTDGID